MGKNKFAEFFNAVVRNDIELVEQLLLLDATAAAGSSPSTVRQLLDATGGLNKTRPHLTLLHVAVHKGSARMVQLLLDAGAFLSSQQEQQHKEPPPLILAVQKDHLDIVRVLISHSRCGDGGVSIVASSWDRYKRTALHHAAVDGSVKMIKLLVAAGANVAAQDDEGKTPLYFAAQHNKVDAVRLLLNLGAPILSALTPNSNKHDDESVRDRNLGGYQVNPLYRATEYMSTDTLRTLIVDANASSWFCTSDKYQPFEGCVHCTPLRLTALFRSFKAAEVLLNGSTSTVVIIL